MADSAENNGSSNNNNNNNDQQQTGNGKGPATPGGERQWCMWHQRWVYHDPDKCKWGLEQQALGHPPGLNVPTRDPKRNRGPNYGAARRGNQTSIAERGLAGIERGIAGIERGMAGIERVVQNFSGRGRGRRGGGRGGRGGRGGGGGGRGGSTADQNPASAANAANQTANNGTTPSFTDLAARPAGNSNNNNNNSGPPREQ